jgi:hypothetical protein
VLCLPGLLGGLLLGLGFVALFRTPALRWAYDTPVPLLAAVALLVMPFALVLRAVLDILRGDVAVHAAALLGRAPSGALRARARRLVWQLRHRGGAWAAFALFWWAYFELAASKLLSPSGMTPASVRLYDQMHYGTSAGLSAMVCTSVAVPLALLAAALAATARLWRAPVRV